MKNPPIVALLCPAMHDLVDNGFKYADDVVTHEGRRYYRLYLTGEDHREDQWALVWKEIPDGTDRITRRRARGRGGDAGKLVLDILPYLQGGHSLRAPADRTGLVLDAGLPLPELTYEEWADQLRRAAGIQHRIQWVLADLMLYGDDRWPEAWQVIDDLGYTQETVANMISVARAIPPSSRDENVPYSVARALAPVFREDAHKGAELMARAASEGWTASEARRVSRPPQAVSHECPECGASHKRKELAMKGPDH